MVALRERETQVRVREIPPPTRRGDTIYTGTRGVNKNNRDNYGYLAVLTCQRGEFVQQ